MSPLHAALLLPFLGLASAFSCPAPSGVVCDPSLESGDNVFAHHYSSSSLVTIWIFIFILYLHHIYAIPIRYMHILYLRSSYSLSTQYLMYIYCLFYNNIYTISKTYLRSILYI